VSLLPPLPLFARRDALRLGAGAVAALLSGCSRAGRGASPGVWINLEGQPGYRGVESEMPAEERRRQYRLVVTDLANFERRERPVSFPGHSLTTSPHVPDVVVMAEKWGPCLASYDYRTMELLAEVELPEGREFIGHVAFAPGGDVIYCSEGSFVRGEPNYARGIIGVRNPRTLELIREFPSHGENPHEVLLIEGGRTLVVANQGTERRPVVTYGNLSYVDTETGALIERLGFPSNELVAAHMRTLSNGNVVMVSKTFQFHSELGNSVYLRFGREPIVAIDPGEQWREAFRGEILSIDLDEPRMRVGTTCPDSQHVIFWDLAQRRLEQVFTLERPLGIALTRDGRFWVVNDIAGGTHVWDAATLEKIGTWLPESVAQTRFTAPHAHIAAARG
jgi:hypothetical protein